MKIVKSVVVFASLAAVSLFGGTAFAQGAKAGTCEIFEHYDFAGKSGTVVGNQKSGDAVLFVSEASAPKDLKDFLGGRVGYRLFYDASWNNILSSVKVGKGCTAEFHNSLAMQQGSTMPFDSYTSDTARVKNNDKAQMVICRCK
ncbi:MAG: hypothetical protein RLZZ598_1162 [Pseudomonadota bacterium]|jgi:hypothetical protein